MSLSVPEFSPLARLGLTVSDPFFGHLLRLSGLKEGPAPLAEPTKMVPFLNPDKQVLILPPARMTVRSCKESHALVQMIRSEPFRALHATFPVLIERVPLMYTLNGILLDILIQSCPLLRRGLDPSLLKVNVASTGGALL